MWTASQSSRGAMSAASADQEHMGGSVAKTETADLVLSINRNSDEEEQGIMRLHVVKARNDAARYDIIISSDLNRMAFWIPSGSGGTAA